VQVVAIQTVEIAFFLALQQQAVEKAVQQHKATQAVRAEVLVTAAVRLILAVWELLDKEIGGNGGSGFVSIRYPDTFDLAVATTGSPTITTSGGYRIYQWTGSGSVTF
jgi:hypothetical protein